MSIRSRSANKEIISGLDDEFRLSGNFPRLIYVKEPAPLHEEKLNEMLNTIRSDAGVSYKSFSSPEELSKLITDDLAILISERFYLNEIDNETAEKNIQTSNLPAHLPALVGRESELTEVNDLILNKGTHLLTITGPGGIGKTRFAQTAAKNLHANFNDGAYFIDLSNVTDENKIPDEIAAVFGVKISKDGDQIKSISDFIASQKILLILDNFEHLANAALKISSLLGKCANLVMIVTSRNPLNVSLENEYSLHGLAIPLDSDEPADMMESPSVKLFQNRAHSADNKFVLNDDNIYLVSDICRMLEGIPLAIELAAAKVRLFSPKMLKERLNQKLNLLSGEVRMHPHVIKP
ncbi:MAG: AAA family ATPase [Ignavibacteria bacterium]